MEMDDVFSWRRSLDLLNLVLHQRRRKICWAISIVRHLESLYRLEGVLVRLSIQELLNCIPRNLINRYNGDLLEFSALADFLRTNGTVAEADRPFTCVVHRNVRAPTVGVQNYQPFSVEKHSYNDYSREKFEDMLRKTLHKSPVAARIIVAEGFDSLKADEIYKPDEEKVKDGAGHMVLITGCGRDENGNLFWEAQDSFGNDQGDNGYIKIARFDEIVTDFFEISISLNDFVVV